MTVAMNQVALAALCVAWMFYCAIATVVEDDNAIIDLAFDNYYKAVNVSGTLTGCRPIIVRGPKGSRIQPVPGWRAHVAIIVEPGNCDPHDHFACIVFWDAPTNKMQKQDFTFLANCQLEHQYLPVDQSYTVMVMYCLIDVNGDVMPACCDQYMRPVDVSDTI